jgi:hypothetical protein
MGTTRTPTFRVEATSVRLRDGKRFHEVLLGWRGTATDAKLAEWVETFDTATAPGGVNAHLGQHQTTRAKVVRQTTGETVATFVRPMFEAVA